MTKLLLRLRTAIFLVLLIPLLFIPLASATLQSGVVEAYNFSETSGAPVDGLLLHNMSKFGSPALGDAGIIDYAVYTSNTNYFTAPRVPLSIYGSNISVCLWIKANATAAGQFIYSERTNSSSIYPVVVTVDSSGKPAFTIKNTGGTGVDGLSNYSITGNTWQFFCGTYDGANIRTYINGTLQQLTAQTGNMINVASGQQNIGMNDGGSSPYTGLIDNLVVWGRTLGQSEITQLWNSGAGLQYPFTTTPVNFTITAKDYYNSTSLSNITATYTNGLTTTTEYTTNGTVTTSLLSDSAYLWNITLSSNDSYGYYNVTYLNYNVSTSLAGSLQRTYLASANYSGNYTYTTGRSLVRNLSYTVVVDTCWQNGVLEGIVNGANTFNVSFSCSALQNISISGSYVHSSESNYTLTFAVPSSFNTSSYTGNTFTNFSQVWNFTEDLYPPNVYLNYSFAVNFTTNSTANFSLRCQDTYSYFNLSYNLTDNSVSLISQNASNNQTLNATGALQNGVNTLTGTCSDPFGSNTSITTFSAYSVTAYLVNEISGLPFNISQANVTSAKLWLGDNATYFDFKSANTTNISVRTTDDTTLRLEIDYVSGAQLASYFNLLYLNSSSLRMCAKDSGLTVNQQLITSATQRYVAISNAFGTCYIAADLTQFAYQNTYTLQAFTLASKYYLYTPVANVTTLIASIDGSIAATTNIETLLASLSINVNTVNADALTAVKTSENIYSIYYYNGAGTVSNGTLTVTNLDNNSLVARITSFTNASNWNLILNTSDIANQTNSTQFKIQWVYVINGKTNTQTVFVSPASPSQGVLPAQVGIILSIFVFVFGLSLVATRYAFGWFGMVMVLGALLICAVSVQTWYIMLMEAVYAIIVVFIAIFITQFNQSALLT